MRFLILTFIFLGTLYAENTNQLLTEGIAFIEENRPPQDVKTIDKEFITQDVQYALKVKNQYTWAKKTPWAIYKNDVLPYAVVNEDRAPWREDFHQLFHPVVKDCATATEAAKQISSQMGKLVKVQYSIEREKPHQNAQQSMKSGKASCTGLSILLVNALRSVGIPARMAGILSWNHIRGNHSWVEAWCDGEWHMIEYNESDFNTGWVLENLTMINPKIKEQRVIAASWSKNDKSPQLFFPMVWTAEVNKETDSIHFPKSSQTVPGINVTDRYLKLAQAWYKAQPESQPGTKLLIEFLDNSKKSPTRIKAQAKLINQEKVLAQGETPLPTDDVRKFLTLILPETQESATLTITSPSGKKFTQTIKHSDSPIQIIRAQVPDGN